MPPNQHHLEYAPPVIRAPSPASSVGTVYGPDQTSLSDSEEQLDQPSFERKIDDRLSLGNMRHSEEMMNMGPLLYRHPPGSMEENRQLLFLSRSMTTLTCTLDQFQQVMHSLYHGVRLLEENELFNQAILRGSQVGLQQQPSTTDIDSLMRSMMVAPQSSTDQKVPKPSNLTSDSGLITGPWASNGFDSQGTTPIIPTAGKRSRNGSRRNP